MKKIVFVSCFLMVMLPLTAIGALPHDVRYPSSDAAERIYPNDHFAVWIQKGGMWEEVGSLAYSLLFRDQQPIIHPSKDPAAFYVYGQGPL